METQFQSVKNSVYSLTEREQRKLLNQLAFKFGIRLHARMAGGAEYTDDDVDDYKAVSPRNSQNFVNNYDLTENHKIVIEIINKDKSGKFREYGIYAMKSEVETLCQILKANELRRLNYEGLYHMIRVVRQAKCSSVTNLNSYILKAYNNLINAKDYQKQWRTQQKIEQGEIDEATVEWWQRQVAINN